MFSEPVLLKVFATEAEAYAARTLLEAGGITAFVLKNDWGGTKDMFFPLESKFELHVAEKDLGRAKQLLNST